MKKILILTVCLIAGIATSFGGGTRTVTYSVSSDGKLTVSGVEPSGSTVEFTNHYSKKNQMTGGNNSTLILRGYDGYIVQNLTLSMKSNQSAGAGNFSFKHGDKVIAQLYNKEGVAFNKWYNITAYTGEYTDVRVSFNDEYINGFSVDENNELTITIAATVNSLYIQSYTITYQISDGVLEAPIITPTKGEMFYRKQQIEITSNEDVDAIYYTTDGTEPTTSSYKYDGTTPLYIDKTLTVNAIAVKDGLQSKARKRSYERIDNIKAIVATTESKSYMMTKDKRGTSNHLLSRVANEFYNGIVLCAPTNYLTFAWQFYDDGKIQDCKSEQYLNNNSSNILLETSGKVKWGITDEGIVLSGSDKRYLGYNTSGYFGAYTNPKNYALAHPVELVKGYLRTELSNGNWGTICLPYEVLSDDISGAVFYNIVGKNIEGDKVVSLMLEEETGTLVAGRPYLFQATSDALCCMYLDNAEESNAAAAGENNGLIGCLSQTDVAKGMFILNGNKVIKCGSGCKVNAYRAYIDMNEVPEIVVQPQSSRRVIEMGVGSGDGTTGIESVEQDRRDGIYYNLQGQKVVAPTRGLYIVNGKKVIKK